MKGRGYAIAGLGLLGLLTGGYRAALNAEKENMEQIESRRYDTELKGVMLENEARMLYEQGGSLSRKGMELSRIALEAPEGPGRWADAAGMLKAASEKYTHVIRMFPGSVYAGLSQAALDTLYMDPVLLEEVEYNQKVRIADTLPLGKKTVIVDFVDRTHDALVDYRLFDESGAEVDLDHLNPFRTSRTISLVGKDWTPAELTAE